MLRDKEEELIWKFLDGDLTPSEQAVVEEKLELDERFRAEMADTRDLDSLLLNRTAELPSLRFATSVMERVRAKRGQSFASADIPRRFIGWYLGSFATMLLGLILVAINLEDSSTLLSANTQAVAEAISSQLDKPYLQLFFQVSIGVGFLLLLDVFLRRKLQKGPNAV